MRSGVQMIWEQDVPHEKLDGSGATSGGWPFGRFGASTLVDVEGAAAIDGAAELSLYVFLLF